jgi:ribosomal protein S18 acetylase RimI-like enzyme
LGKPGEVGDGWARNAEADVLLSIREALHADVAEIAAVRIAAADALTARFGEGLWTSNTTENGVMLVMKHGRVIVAVRGGAIVGTLTLSTRKPLAINASYFTRVRTPIYLTSMAIHPQAQGQGIGRTMLADAEARARKWPGGAGQAIRLDAFNADAGAAGFYARCGYQERGRAVFRSAPLIYFERLLPDPAG